MRDETPSRTAAWVAAARSLGTFLPPEARLADDPYGLRFTTDVRPPRASAIAVKSIFPLRRWVMYMQVRTRVLDDALLRFVEGGGRQIVLLGAGYDCRALRFADRLRGATVFEVDHPATQGKKRAVLGDAPAARYLAWHFEDHPMSELPAALAGIGHDATRPTLTIWEGVTMYLTEPAIDASVRAIRAWSAPGSQLAFTYFTREVFERPGLITRMASAVVKVGGEPWKWAWNPHELPAWLAARGFALDQDLAIADEARRMLPRAWARGLEDGRRRIALAGPMVETIAVASAR